MGTGRKQTGRGPREGVYAASARTCYVVIRRSERSEHAGCRGPAGMADWADGPDLDVTSAKLIPKLGRRAGHSNISHEDKLEDEALDSPESSSRKPSAKGSAPPVPPRSRKTGWGDELKSAKHRGVSAVDQDRFLSNNKNVRDDDIPVIPDLDEIIEETNAIDISKIPSIGANRAAAAAYEELDTDFVKNKKFSTFDGVDLSVLVDNLYPEHLVRETDEVWSWESLFNQVASEINTESGTKDDESH